MWTGVSLKANRTDKNTWKRSRRNSVPLFSYAAIVKKKLGLDEVNFAVNYKIHDNEEDNQMA